MRSRPRSSKMLGSRHASMSRILLLPLVFFSAVSCTRSAVTNKVVVDVNGTAMTAGQFAEELAFRLRELDALTAKDPKLLDRTKNKIAEDFVVQTLCAQWAKDHGLLVKAEAVEAEIKKFRSGYPDDLAFQQALTEQGLTYKNWRSRLKQTLLQRMVIQKISEAFAKPSDAEIKAYYDAHKTDFMEKESVQIRQIVLANEGDAQTVEQELKKGRSLSSLIPKYSTQPKAQANANPSNPAVMWLKKGESPVFESAFKLKPGRLSPIMKSDFGYHIFEVLSHKPAKQKALADVKANIMRILMEKNEQTAYLSWLDAEVRKARVFKDQELIDSMKVETKAE